MTGSTRFLWGAILACSLSGSIAQEAPLVTVLNGTYSGVHSSSYNQDFFLGIPFALPPVRFSPAKSLNSTWNGLRSATEYGAICHGYGNDAIRLAQLGKPVSEDCLTINIVRPSQYTDQLLPVGVYIYGGGYHMGGSSDPRLNFSFIVQESVAAGVPILGVSFNYRVSAYGFLGGSEILKAGAANLGFRDQRLALHWIQENIAAFGGDPSKVTIYGNSAGAGSVGAQLLAYNGRDDALFRGAIAESGSPVGFTPFEEFLPTDTWDEVYANLTSGTGCDIATDTLDCLRNVPIDFLDDLVNSTATSAANYGPTLDNDFVVDLPARQLARGDFVKVPYILGSNTDEGSAFIPGSNFDNKTFFPTSKIDTDAEFLDYIVSLGVNSSIAKKLADLYPQMGSEQAVSTYKNDLGSEIGYQYKRGVTFAGDYWIIASTRYAAQIWTQYGVPAYKYRWNVLVSGIPGFIGATHAKEIVFVFDDTTGTDYDVDPWLNKPQSYLDLATIMARSWATFISTGNPNLNGSINGTSWPRYTKETPQEFVFDANVTSYVEDDIIRKEGIDYLISLF